MTMTTLAVRGPQAVGHLDIASLRRAFLVLGVILAVVAPFTPDPVAFGVGGFVGWITLVIAGTPNLPVALVYYLMWQWVQIFARAVLGLVDGVPMARGFFGPWVVDAYWYMLASVVVLAIAIRMVLGSLKPPSPRDATAHLAWGPVELFQFYLASLSGWVFTLFARGILPGLDQPMDALVRVKLIALFMLFVGVLSRRIGYTYLLTAVLIEILTGFAGFLGDFRTVFIILFLAALAARIPWTIGTTLLVSGAAIVVVVLGLFWTSVKSDYRQMVTGDEDSQYITVSLDERLGYLLARVADAGEIDWSEAAYLLLYRLAYVDIFGQVIGVNLASADHGVMRQWSEAISHVLQPRFLFPGKAVLSDSDVYMRLTRADPNEAVRQGTSISVGYMAENHVDLGFPGMLAGVFVIGLGLAAVCRYFMKIRAPWVVREGTVLAVVYSVGSTGTEISLPKILGAIFMTFLVYSILAKFFYPFALRWLDQRALLYRGRQTQQVTRAASQRPYRK